MVRSHRPAGSARRDCGVVRRGPASAQDASPARAAAEQKQLHYQIGTMERVLEGAVEHGVALTRDRLQAIADRLQTVGLAPMLILDNPRVRGFRLDGYGIFFDVEVPSLERSSRGACAPSIRTISVYRAHSTC